MKIALGADHGGFSLKEELKAWLEGRGIDFEDFGTYNAEPDDYPIVAAKVARYVASRGADFGVLVCSTGIGISIAANKVRGIRAAACSEEITAEFCRRHNNANVLCMGARIVDRETAFKLLEIFLNTPFEGGRHSRRVEQISQIEDGKL